MPISPIEYVSLIGAWGLDLVSILAFKRKKVSLVIAAAGLIGSWSFYIPVLAQTLHQAQHVVWEPFVFIALSLLSLATVYFALDLGMYVRKMKASRPTTS